MLSDLVGVDEPYRATFRRQPKSNHVLWALKDVSLKIQPGEVVEYEDRVPIEFGGEPIPTKASYVLEAVDNAKHEARIAWRQRLDEQAARASRLAMLKAMAEKMGKPAPKPADVPVVTAEDEGEWVMSTSTGWPVSMSFARKSMAGEQGRLETTRMTAQRTPGP